MVKEDSLHHIYLFDMGFMVIWLYRNSSYNNIIIIIQNSLKLVFYIAFIQLIKTNYLHKHTLKYNKIIKTKKE